MSAIQLPAIFAGIKSRKDKSFRLEFDTQELPPADAAQLLNLHQAFCALIVAPSEHDLTDVDIPDYKPLEGDGKSPSKRLRAVMYIYWKQQGGDPVLGDFDTWYSARMNFIIDSWKAKLDSDEFNDN